MRLVPDVSNLRNGSFYVSAVADICGLCLLASGPPSDKIALFFLGETTPLTLSPFGLCYVGVSPWDGWVDLSLLSQSVRHQSGYGWRDGYVNQGRPLIFSSETFP